MGFYNLWIGNLIDPEDDFAQPLRKSAVAVFFFPGGLFLTIYLLLPLYKILVDGAEGALLTVSIASLLSSLSLLVTVVIEYGCTGSDTLATSSLGEFDRWCPLRRDEPFYVDRGSFPVYVAILAILLQISQLPLFPK
jgi:hypothetical protein